MKTEVTGCICLTPVYNILQNSDKGCWSSRCPGPESWFTESLY